MSVSLKVKIFESAGTRIVQVSKSTLTIGRASHCDIVLDDPSVNEEHTRAWLDGGRIWIQDLGSPSGTSLNDIRLPALKPMLVRDLDVLRLGESVSTVGLEAVLVRAPVVKPKAPEPMMRESAALDAKGLSKVELQKRREEAERLAREVAEMRLQLQMGGLEKAATDEVGQQAADLRAEVERIQEQKARWDEKFKQMEAEKAAMRKNIDKDLLEFKAKALKDLKKAASAESMSQIEKLNAQIETLGERLRDANEKLQTLEREKEALRVEMNSTLEAEKSVSEDTQRHVQEVSSEVKKLQSETRRLSDEVKKLNDQKAKLSESLRQSEEEKASLRGEVKKSQAAEKFAAENSQRQIESVSAEIDDLTKDKRRLADENHKLGEELRKLNEQKLKLSETLHRAETDRENLRAEMERTLAAEKSVSEDTQRHALEINGEVKRLGNETRRLNDEIKKLNEQKTKMAEALRQAESDKEELRAEMKRTVAAEKSVSQDTQRHALEINGEVKRLGDETRRLNDEIKKLNEQKTKMAEALRQAESDKEELRAEMKRTVAAEKSVSQDTQRHALEINGEVKRLGDETRRLNDEIKKLNEQKTKMAEALRQAESDKEELRAEMKRTVAAEKSVSEDTQRHALEINEDFENMKVETRRLQDEVRKLGEQKAKINESWRETERERELLRAELKKALTSEKNLAAETERTVTNVNSELKKLNDQKAKLAESLRQSEIEKEVMRKTLEREKSAKAALSASMSTASTRSRQASGHDEVEAARERRRKRRDARESSKVWRSVSVTSFIVALVLAGVWIATSYLKGRGGNRSLSSHARVEAPPPVKKVAKVPRKFAPKVSKKFRNSYTDNVLYLQNYVAAEENIEFRKRWMVELNKVASRNWKMDTWTISPISLQEQNLIQDLDRIKKRIATTDQEAEGLAKMHEREAKFMRDLDSVFKTRANVERFLKFKRSFYLRNQGHLSKAD